MKNMCFTLSFVALMLSCNSDEVSVNPEVEPSLVGRWHLVGFETTVMYEFTDTLRYTIYSSDGTFGGVETAIPNPNSWVWDGDQVVVDMNFGNESRLTPVFKCEGQVIDWYDSEDQFAGTYFRENFDYSSCTE
jgi:hypothetical protein